MHGLYKKKTMPLNCTLSKSSRSNYIWWWRCKSKYIRRIL